MSTLQAAQRGPVALIIATISWPLSARLAVRLVKHGCTVDALCPRSHPLYTVSGVRRIDAYSGSDPVASLDEAIAQSKPDIIVPCDDRAVWQLHELHERRPDLQRLIERSIGSAHSFPVLRSRAVLMQLAAEVGVRVPRTRPVMSQEDLDRWFREHHGPAVIKLDGTWGGRGVRVVTSVQDTESARIQFRRAERRLVAWKHRVVDRDPLAFWTAYKPESRGVSIQEFIPGHPANTMVAAWQGRVLGLVSVEVLCAQNSTAPSTIVRLIRNEEMERASRALVEKLGLSGFHGLDFILEEGTGAPHLIEVNPRCTHLGHLVLPEQGDLAGLLCAKIGAHPESEPPIKEQLIAFYPQAIACNPSSPYMQQCYHDVPWSEPRLVRALIRNRWVAEEWLRRLFGWLTGREPNPLPSILSFLHAVAENHPARGGVGRLSDAS